MSVHRGASSCLVLREDPDLAEAIPAERRRRALQECTALELYVPAGRGFPRGVAPVHDGVGLLVLNGLLIRRVGIEGRFGAELLGEGDLLRPWQEDRFGGTLLLETGWSVIEPLRLAVLDNEFVQRLSSYPELSGMLVGRAMQRARNLAVNMAIVHQARVEVRLQMLLWHLAARWGRVRRDGTALPLRLTHAVLSELVAARRPTVSAALSDLAKRGLIRFLGEEWLLSGEPPRELLEVEASAQPQVAAN